MEKDMTTGKPFQLIISFVLPLFIGNMLQQVYSMVDTIIVGRFVGVKALAAVGSTSTIIFLILGFFLGLTSGFTVLTAQRFGAGDLEGMKKTVSTAIFLTAVITVAVTFVSLLGMSSLLRLMNTPADIFENTYRYIIIMMAGLFTQVAYNLAASILRALGNSKVPLYFLMVAAGLNIVLDLLLVVVFHMGVAGVAYATVISQGVSALLCFVYIRKKVNVLHLRKEHRRLEGRLIRQQMSIGLPMAFQFSITAIGAMMVQSSLNKLGSTAVAAFAAAGKGEQLITQFFPAVGVTMSAYAAQNMGAFQFDRIREGARITMLLSLAYSIFAGIIVVLLGPIILQVFVDPKEVEVIAYGSMYFKVVAPAFTFLSWIYIYRNILQGMGFTFMPMMAGVAELLSRAVMAVIASSYGSFLGICMANAAAWISAGFLLLFAYLDRMKKLQKNNFPKESQESS